jgi:hypothetical protein
VHQIAAPAPGLSLFIQDDGHRLLAASAPFARGQVLHRFHARKTLARPTYLTVQMGPAEHILLGPEFLQYINHGCEPNVHFDVARREIVCLRDIAAGEEILFFYPSTELDMDRPFACRCGAPSCLGAIRGAAHLPSEVLSRFVLNDHVASSLLSGAAQNAAS